MRKLFVVAAVIAAVGFVATHATPAEAGPIWQVALVSLDAGSSQTVSLSKKVCYCVQAKYSQTCMKLGNKDGGSLLAGLYGADCSKDFIIPQQVVNSTVVYPAFCFDSAGRDAIVVANIDGGPANTNLFLLESNPVNPVGCSTLGQGL